jgi:hypothetical protein
MVTRLNLGIPHCPDPTIFTDTKTTVKHGEKHHRMVNKNTTVDKDAPNV